MKKFFLFLVSSLLFLFLFSCKPEILEGYTLYENSEHNFSIQYPENWQYREGFAKDSENLTGAIVVLQSPFEGKGDFFKENTYIFTENIPDTVTNVGEYLDYTLKTLPSQMNEFNKSEDGREIINGKESIWIKFSYVSRMQRLESLAYIFYKDGMGYVINSTTRPELFIKYRRTFENISRTMKFN